MTQEPGSDDAPDLSAEATARTPGLEHGPAALRTLKLAMRRARFDDAERIGVIADLRAARIGRLEMLQDALQPLAAQIPEDVDLFDFGLMPGATPRLFLDMIGFVEMGRDAHTYRLLQDTRHGRCLIAETDRLETMVDRVTDYVARRLLERDKALAADGQTLVECTAKRVRPPAPHGGEPREHRPGIAAAVLAFVIDLLGSIALFTILFASLFWLGWLALARIHGPH